MQKRRIPFSFWFLMTSLWTLPLMAQELPPQVYMTDNNVTVSGSLKMDYKAFYDKLQNDPGSLLAGLGFVNVTLLSDMDPPPPANPAPGMGGDMFGPVGGNPGFGGFKMVERQKTMVVRTAYPRIVPESLIQVKETRTECSTPGCGGSVSMEFTGPVATYQHDIALVSPPDFLGSLSMTLNASPSWDGSTAVTLSFNILNRSYLRYVKYLFERKVLTELPTEDEMKKGFALWAKSFLKSFSKQSN